MKTPFLSAALCCLAAASPVLAEDAKEDVIPNHPLGVWTKLVGGQWLANGAWTNGQPFEGRIVAEWEFGKRFLRFRNLIPVKDGDYVRYDSIYYVHPGNKKPCWLSTDFEGKTNTGTFEIDGRTATFVYEVGGEGTPRIKSLYTFLTDDECRWQVFMDKAGEWSPLLDVKYVRGELVDRELIRTKQPEPHRLARLGGLIGGAWGPESESADEDAPRAVARHEWGLTHQVMEARLSMVTGAGYEDFGVMFAWWDEKSKRVRLLGFTAADAVQDGELHDTEGELDWTWTEHPKEGDPVRIRARWKFDGEDRANVETFVLKEGEPDVLVARSVLVRGK